jgi:hypothetical protein
MYVKIVLFFASNLGMHRYQGEVFTDTKNVCVSLSHILDKYIDSVNGSLQDEIQTIDENKIVFGWMSDKLS